jgi:hypothetical protein
VEKVTWFLSHKQATGQAIALPLFLKLKEFGDAAFLDIASEFDLHDLEKIVELTSYFIFILSPGIFTSDFCRKGTQQYLCSFNLVELTHAVKCKKPIVVIQDRNYQFVESDIPKSWSAFAPMLLGHKSIVYYSQFLTQCARQLQDINKFPEQNKIDFYSPEDSRKKN